MLDRETGKPVWPIPEKTVPKGDVPGEWYSPTQPIPSAPPPFAKQGVTRGRPGGLDAGDQGAGAGDRQPLSPGLALQPPPLVNDKIFGALEPAGPAGRHQLAGRVLRSRNPSCSICSPRTSSRSPASCRDRTARSFQRGGPPAAGSADANGGAFGGVASLKGATGPAARFERPRRPDTIPSCRA